jgi:hypothetical protein
MLPGTAPAPAPPNVSHLSNTGSTSRRTVGQSSPRGGRFVAAEEPDLLAGDIAEFFADLR